MRAARRVHQDGALASLLQAFRIWGAMLLRRDLLDSLLSGEADSDRLRLARHECHAGGGWGAGPISSRWL